MEIVDVLSTVFKTSGVQSAIFAMSAAENATDRLAMAEARLQKAQANAYYGGGSMDQVNAAQRRFNIAQRRENEATFTEAIAAAQPYINVLNKIVSLSEKITDATAKFGTEVLNLKAITGGSGTESAGILNLFNGAGIGSGGASALAGLNKKVFSGEGQGALAQLGISPTQGETSIQLFDQIAERLNKMQDGWYKMRIEQQLGVEGMQELLRMSDNTRQKILQFSDSMGGDALPTIQRFNEATGLLKVGIEAGIVQPIGVELMKAITPALDLINDLIEAWHKFDTAIGGFGTKIVVIAGLAVAFGAAVGAIRAVGSALQALMTIERVQIVLEAIEDALEGPAGWAKIAAAVAVGGAAAGIIAATGGAASDGANKVDEFGRHIDDFGDSVRQWRDQWGNAGSALPRNLSANDAAHLLRMQALGVVG